MDGKLRRGKIAMWARTEVQDAFFVPRISLSVSPKMHATDHGNASLGSWSPSATLRRYSDTDAIRKPIRADDRLGARGACARETEWETGARRPFAAISTRKPSRS